MKNLSGLMKQASQMQSKMQEMQEKIAATTMEGSAGNGLVRVIMTGKGDLLDIRIDAKLCDPSDTETVQDLIIAAHRDAKARIDQLQKSEMSRITGGLNLPPGLSLPF
jgi:DNA-binding YbaB/EbfC family protein